MMCVPRFAALCLAASLSGPTGVHADVPPPEAGGPQSPEGVLPDTVLGRDQYDYRAGCIPAHGHSVDAMRCLELRERIAAGEFGQAEGGMRACLMMSDKTLQQKMMRLDDWNASVAQFMTQLDVRCGGSSAHDRNDDAKRELLQCRIDATRQRTSQILAEIVDLRKEGGCGQE